MERKRKIPKIAKDEGFEMMLHRWNPQIESEFGPYLLNETIHIDITSKSCWDNLVDRFLGRATSVSDLQLSIERLQPITEANLSFFLLVIDVVSSELMNAALYAGFFPFAIGLDFPSGVSQEDCGIVALELAGRSQEKTSDDLGGRIILQGLQHLIIGKRAVKEISKVIKDDPLQVFTLEWSTSWSEIDNSWETLIEKHGINWLGYSRIRNCLRELNDLDIGCAQLMVFQINRVGLSEDSERKCQCLSLEVGYIIGACYTCLSNWSDSTFPRIGQVRSAAVPIFLHKHGIQLFDVGGKFLFACCSHLSLSVTAEYYLNFNGYHRSSREEFVYLWREHRAGAISSLISSNEKIDVMKLLSDHQLSHKSH
jgi:hypothetical protein